MSAYLAGRPVYWLNAIDGMDDFQEKLSLVAHDNALVIIDEAHTKVMAVRDVIDRIIPTHSDFQIVFLHTKGIGMQANQPSDIGYFSKYCCKLR